MRRFFDNMRYRMQQWSYGRYGYDELSKFIYVLDFVLLLAAFIPHCSFFVYLSLIGFIYVSFRSLSRNVAKRRLENERFLKLTQPIRERSEQKRKIREEKKYYAFFQCSKCHNLNRVPKGKGKIRITCPKCGAQSVHKT